MKHLLAVVLALAAVSSHAQQYPSKPVRLIVSYVPGGVSDTLARLVAKELTEEWNTSVIVENRPGASGNIGTTQCVKSPPDGYTMCIVAVAQSMASRVAPNAGFDSLKDFSHVTLVASVPMLLLVHPSLPAYTARDLIALAKKRPGELNYATSGVGSGPQLAMELFKQQAGIDIVMVQYKGGGQAVFDQIAGRVETAFSAAVGVIPYVNEGKLRAVGVSTRERFPVLPKVPTISESGLKGYDASSWQGLSMPAGVPREIVNRANAALVKVLKSPQMRERFLALGAVPVGNSPEAFAAFFNAESEKWYRVAKTAGVIGK
ncbi:MAG TPA: tripartite tricarboxylate transporter substrate binding protein [Burkholderiales bacterium]|nr:tripartite tricarboxylate transporter substrate binding protein [Burkholderiales bacterium]